jgi:hypothetical protein
MLLAAGAFRRNSIDDRAAERRQLLVHFLGIDFLLGEVATWIIERRRSL